MSPALCMLSHARYLATPSASSSSIDSDSDTPCPPARRSLSWASALIHHRSDHASGSSVSSSARTNENVSYRLCYRYRLWPTPDLVHTRWGPGVGNWGAACHVTRRLGAASVRKSANVSVKRTRLAQPCGWQAHQHQPFALLRGSSSAASESASEPFLRP